MLYKDCYIIQCITVYSNSYMVVNKEDKLNDDITDFCIFKIINLKSFVQVLCVCVCVRAMFIQNEQKPISFIFEGKNCGKSSKMDTDVSLTEYFEYCETNISQ